ncbi:MAG: Hcp family type VI secretion system effector [Beijerinckiaceae bacterium]
MSQADYFLKIDGIEGESGDAKHKNEIELESWSFGASNSGSFGHGMGGGTGKVSMQDFHFVMKMNKATPNLFLSCSSGKHIPKAVLTCRKAGTEDGPQEYFVVTFEDLLISSYQTGGSQGSGAYPSEQISFNFTKIKMDYKMQDEKGIPGKSVIAGWDTKKNVKM